MLSRRGLMSLYQQRYESNRKSENADKNCEDRCEYLDSPLPSLAAFVTNEISDGPTPFLRQPIQNRRLAIFTVVTPPTRFLEMTWYVKPHAFGVRQASI